MRTWLLIEGCLRQSSAPLGRVGQSLTAGAAESGEKALPLEAQRCHGMTLEKGDRTGLRTAAIALRQLDHRAPNEAYKLGPWQRRSIMIIVATGTKLSVALSENR